MSRFVRGEEIPAIGDARGQIRELTADLMLGKQDLRFGIDDRNRPAAPISDHEPITPVNNRHRHRLAMGWGERESRWFLENSPLHQRIGCLTFLHFVCFFAESDRKWGFPCKQEQPRECSDGTKRVKRQSTTCHESLLVETWDQVQERAIRCDYIAVERPIATPIGGPCLTRCVFPPTIGNVEPSQRRVRELALRTQRAPANRGE